MQNGLFSPIAYHGLSPAGTTGPKRRRTSDSDLRLLYPAAQDQLNLAEVRGPEV